MAIKFSLFTALTFGLISTCVASSVDASETGKTDQALTSLAKEFSLPSLSVAIGQDQRIAYQFVTGFADIEKRQLATADTQYSIGSLAKPMTGVVLAKLVDDGKLKLSDKVSQYVSKPTYTDQFTVEQLAAHLAGVPHETRGREIAEFERIKDHRSPFDAFYVFASEPLSFKPGTQYEYSSNGYILLSGVIEVAARRNYVDVMKKMLWDSFEMENTELDTSAAGAKSEARYYAEVKNGQYQAATTQRDRSFLFGGGGFISTPTDLVKFARSTYKMNYLTDTTRTRLSQPVKLNNGEENKEKYSLGWRVGSIKLNADSDESWLALHHGGVTDKAATSYLLVIPECKASIAFTTNYIPEKFWKMRGVMARILMGYIDISTCEIWQNK